jgi:hypothetical protein
MAVAMDLSELWTVVKADLARARNTLPNDAATHKAIKQYEEFLNHNELELACDMLDVYAETQKVTKDFWLALRDAATRMKLSERAGQYEKYASSFD